MKLDLWLKENGLRERDFAQRINRSQATVNRYRLGKRYPRPVDLERIFVATGGNVTPNDFSDMPALPERESEAA